MNPAASPRLPSCFVWTRPILLVLCLSNIPKWGASPRNSFPCSVLRQRSAETGLEKRRATVPQVAVISHAFWQTHFGGARNAIGSSIEIDHKRAVVIGVMPAGFDFPSPETNIWIPLSFISNWPAFLTARQADAFNAIARLQPGITLQRAQQEMDSISTGLSHDTCYSKQANRLAL